MKDGKQIVEEYLQEQLDDRGSFVDDSIFSTVNQFDSERSEAIAKIATTKEMRKMFAQTRNEMRASVLTKLNTFFKETEGYNSDEVSELPDDVLDELMEFVHE